MEKIKKLLSFLLLLTVGLVLTACGSSGDASEEPIVINDGEFTEMKLMYQMSKMLVEDHTDVEVEIRDEMAPQNNYQEMRDDKADAMTTYDGTLLTNYLYLDMSDVPEDTSLYDFVSEEVMERHGFKLLDMIGSENTYAIAVLPETAEEYNLETISDLADVSDEIVFGAEHEFYTEEGNIKHTPFVDFYGIEFKDSKPIDLNLKYSAIESGNIDATMVYTTDGMNRKVGLVMLEDDKEFFPEYNTALLVRNDIFDEYSEVAPNLEDVLNKLGGQFTNETMTDLIYQVDVEEKDVEDVAREFLIEKDLISDNN